MSIIIDLIIPHNSGSFPFAYFVSYVMDTLVSASLLLTIVSIFIFSFLMPNFIVEYSSA